MRAPVDAELADAVQCVKRIYAQRHNRSGDPDSWGTLLVVLRAYANSAEARGRAAEAEPTITPEQTLREGRASAASGKPSTSGR